MTTNKNLTLPANGSYVNTWDSPTNANFSAIDAALGGTITLNTVTGTVVLSSDYTSATSYIPLDIKVTGSLTGNVNYQVPYGVGGIWSIYNNATLNGYTVTFGVQSGGTPYTLPAGFRVLLVTDNVGNVSQADNSATSAGSNTQVIYNSGGYLSGSSNLTFDGSNLSISGVTAATQTYVTGYAPSKTGSGASGTWGISISGNAATATSSGSVTNAVTFNNGGSGGSSGSTFNGSSALTVSYNTVGAPSTTGSGASGTWGINITGNAATVTNGITTSNIGSYAPGLTGSGASGTWGINITGSAASATTATTASTANALNTSNSYTMVNLTATGSVTASGNVTAYSDDRLKTRIRYISGAVAKVMALKGFYYEANEIGRNIGLPETRQIGLSAQDVQAVLPEIVMNVPDTDFLSLDYSRLVAVLVEAIKEQQIVIDALSKKVNG